MKYKKPILETEELLTEKVFSASATENEMYNRGSNGWTNDEEFFNN